MRRPLRLLVLVCAGAILAIAPAVARAGCAEDIVNQAVNTGTVKGHYPLACYKKALTLFNADLVDYGAAPGIVRDALAAERAFQAQQGSSNQDPDAVAPTSEQAAPSDGAPATTKTGSAQGSGTGKGADGTTYEVQTVPDQTDDTAATDADTGGTTAIAAAAGSDDGGGGGGVSLPVLVLGGLALILIAVGAAGLIAARRRST